MTPWKSISLSVAFASVLGSAPIVSTTADAQSGFERGNLRQLIGESLPEVTVYDPDGKPFELAQLKGSYSVLVFGCLT